MRKDFEDACEEIDAAIFTGDSLRFMADLVEFNEYLDRWRRAADEAAKAMLDEVDS